MAKQKDQEGQREPAEVGTGEGLEATEQWFRDTEKNLRTMSEGLAEFNNRLEEFRTNWMRFVRTVNAQSAEQIRHMHRAAENQKRQQQRQQESEG